MKKVRTRRWEVVYKGNDLEKMMNIINRWFEKGKISKDSFDKFIYLRISFNAYYCCKSISLNENGKTKKYKAFLCKDEKKKKSDGDINRILFFVEENQGKFEEFIKKNNDEMNEYFDFINKREHPNHHLKDIGGVVRLDSSKTIRYKDINSLKDFILIIYQVRSNLFHGGKNPNSENSEYLVKETGIIFEKFLEKIL